MVMLFGSPRSPSFSKKVERLVRYCFFLAKRCNGIYIARNKQTVALFYEKQKVKHRLADYMRYIKVVLDIGLYRLPAVLRRESMIARHKLKVSNYLYIWFIAQTAGYGRIDGLVEINNKMFELASHNRIPILMETSDERLLKLYCRAGFCVYDVIGTEDKKTYLLADRNTIARMKPGVDLTDVH